MLLTSKYICVVPSSLLLAVQTFLRVDTPSLLAADDARFEYFRDHILPTLEASASASALAEAAASGTALSSVAAGAAHTLVFVPSYFDYVRLRNLLDARVRLWQGFAYAWPLV